MSDLRDTYKVNIKLYSYGAGNVVGWPSLNTEIIFLKITENINKYIKHKTYKCDNRSLIPKCTRFQLFKLK